MSRAAPTRRMTRSQSRELEPPSYQPELALKSSRATGKGKAIASQLSSVAEETPSSSRQFSLSKHGSPVVPESPNNPEGHTNISGTTFLDHLDESDDDEVPNDPLLMVDELPDLQHVASTLMIMLVSSHEDPINMVNEARRLRSADPKSPETRRLKTACRKLMERMNHFSHETFIDVPHIQSLIPSIPAKDDIAAWSPSPALHNANCARLAYELLLSTAESQSARQMVHTLNSQYPAPFLDKLSSNPSTGSSGAEKATFELALEIRTQHFIAEFEKLQGSKDFDPKALLQSVFYDNSIHQGRELDSRWLRGFALAIALQDENKCLPDRFHDAVLDRIGELRLDMFDDDGAPNPSGLKSSFPWKRFSVRAARFLHSRDREIRRDLKTQANFDDISDIIIKRINDDGPTPSFEPESTDSHPDRHEMADSLSPVVHHSRKGLTERVEQTPAAQTSTPTFAPPRVPSPKPQAQKSIRQPTPSQGQSSTAKDPNRRKSLKGFLSMDNMARLKKRMEDIQPELSRYATSSAAPGSSAAQEHSAPEPDIGDETTFINQADYDFDLDEMPEESTTPPGSARTNQISHHPSQWSVSPPRAQASRRASQSDQQQQTPLRSTYFDRQNNASRVSPINEVESQSAERRPVQRPVQRPVETERIVSRKRRREEEDDDESGDDFEPDSRRINVAEKRAKKPAPRRDPPREQRPEINEADDQLAGELDTSNQTSQPTRTNAVVASARAQALGSSSSAPVSPPAPSPSAPSQPAKQSSWAARNAPDAANMNVSGRRGGKWTEEEDKRLIHLIAAHGTGWAEIIKQDSICPAVDGGPAFTARKRTQTDIKDRARVLRRRFEKRGDQLPRNFENVSKLKW
ncbi:uncharacterized protein N7483_007424 [Penicillium malachiteum]|uniref:uncharacterized protein n=1 Tax=Penicillium malachiteum TaxID=1324776 RepID=UPI00254826A9|nr:uncharacterized protein N7483_007424 [Penicillium malachiteum]KAJ5726067.1 hypothetical protein N7483_007424 [Penicillium malachiteum]